MFLLSALVWVGGPHGRDFSDWGGGEGGGDRRGRTAGNPVASTQALRKWPVSPSGDRERYQTP